MQLHVVSLPHTNTTPEYEWCAYTSKVSRFCEMMMEHYDILLYGGVENSAKCTEFIPCVTKNKMLNWYGVTKWNNDLVFDNWDPDTKPWKEMNKKVITAIKKRIVPGDIVCITAGRCQTMILEAFPQNLHSEWTVGYEGIIPAMSCVFESYSHMHKTYGSYGITQGRFFDAVIPNFYDTTKFHLSYPDNYLLFLGRVGIHKGIHIAAEMSKATKMPLKIAGQGKMDLDCDHEYLGIVTGQDKADLLARAHATIVATTYIEPFGGVAAESQLSGTPVITTDFGAFCVPESAEVLTLRGWLTHPEVRFDDETLGFNFETKMLEWTPIQRVNVFHDQETVEYRNRNWKIRVTPNHKWVTTKKWVTSTQLLQPFEDAAVDDRVTLAALGPNGVLGVSATESAIIAWLLTDGSVGTRRKDGTWPSYKWEEDDPALIGSGKIWQSKPVGIDILRDLLKDVHHNEYTRTGSGIKGHPQPYVFSLPVGYVREIARKARIYDTGFTQFILGLSIDARMSFLKACVDAEGWKASKESTTCISQNDGPFLHAMALCAYLCGHRPTLSEGVVTNGVRNRVIGLANPIIAPRRLHSGPGKTETVWCPTTTLGTWTMRFDDQIVLTGNTETVWDEVTGFRCHTLREFIEAVDKCDGLSRQQIQEWAQSKWSTQVVSQQYHTYFDRLSLLQGSGWYG